MTAEMQGLLQKFENLVGAAWVASEGGRMSEAGVEKKFAAMNSVRDELVQCLEDLESWERAFPGKTAAAVALLLAIANWAIQANGKLMIENQRLRDQRPLTAEEKAWAEKAWQEYKGSPPKDEITCMKCGFKVSRPVEGRTASNCQTCGASYEREAFL